MEQATVTIKTKAFGEKDISPMQCIDFPQGMFGFVESRRFALIDVNEESYFKWLQDTENQDLAFVVMQPELIFPDYRPQVLEDDLAVIDLKSADAANAVTLVVITIPESDPGHMTANLQGPVIINKSTRQGCQVISYNEQHSVRVPLLEGRQ